MATKAFIAKHGLEVRSNGAIMLTTNATTLASNLAIKVGTNFTVNATHLNFGATTANVTSLALGSNLIFTPDTISLGNSTANVTINSTAVFKNGATLGAVPAGVNTSIQINDSGAFGNVTGFTLNKSTGLFSAPGAVVANGALGVANLAGVYLNTANNRYLAYDGTQYVLPSAQLHINGSLAWHAGNDGSGTGLDADLLDGYQGSAFLRLAAGGTVTEDITLYRSASPTTGYVYLGNAGRYFGYNGSQYTMDGAQLLINGGTAWHSGNDGAGTGLDADTVDGVQASAFAQLAGSPTFTTKIMITGGGLQGNQPIANATDSLAALEIQNNGTGAAAIGFHRTGSWACYFGLDTDNVWKVGGWSYGAVAHTLWHSGNDGSGTGLDADFLDGYQASDFAQLSSSPTFTGTVTGSSFNTSSDRELKTNIFDISYLDTMNLKHVKFKEYYLKDDLRQKQYGVIAQDLELLFPNLVKTDNTTGLKSVNYVGLLSLFANRVNEQDNIINNLIARVNMLEGKP